MKKYPFLASLSIVLASLLPGIPSAGARPIPSTSQAGVAYKSTNAVDENAFVLTLPNGSRRVNAEHGSHVSHGSHGSHRSHVSGS